MAPCSAASLLCCLGRMLFVLCWQRLHKLDDVDRARGWLATVTVRTVRRRLRRLRMRRFFHDARALKRRTALAALSRFEAEARRLAGAPPAADDGTFARRLAALEAAHTSVAGALAAERVGLRARLEAAFRQAAREVLEFVRPRRWPFGERSACHRAER